MRAEERQRQQSYYSLKHHVHSGPVPTISTRSLEIPEDCGQQIVRVYAR